MSRKVTVREVINEMGLEVYAGEGGLDHIITDEEITFPWLEFAGVLKYFNAEKINIVGSKEATYLKEIGTLVARSRIEVLFQENPSAIIFSRNVEVFDYFIEEEELFKMIESIEEYKPVK